METNIQTNIQNIIFCVLQKKESQTGLEWQEVEYMMTEFSTEDFSILTNLTRPSRKTMLFDPPAWPTPNQHKLARSLHVSVNNTGDQTTLED